MTSSQMRDTEPVESFGTREIKGRRAAPSAATDRAARQAIPLQTHFQAHPAQGLTSRARRGLEIIATRLALCPAATAKSEGQQDRERGLDSNRDRSLGITPSPHEMSDWRRRSRPSLLAPRGGTIDKQAAVNERSHPVTAVSSLRNPQHRTIFSGRLIRSTHSTEVLGLAAYGSDRNCL
jgi:hypothetical protein